MASTDTCIFCKIVRGDMPADFAYKDDRVVAFADINPRAPVHLLIIPVEHIASMAEAKDDDTELLGHMLQVARRLAEEHGISESGYRIVTNVGAEGGQVVFHLHFHLVGGKSLGRFA